MLDSVNIAKLICKYLEYLDFIRNFSSNTVQAYQSDLLQVFQLKPGIDICRKNINGSVSYQYCLKNTDTKMTLKSELEWGMVAAEGLRQTPLSVRSRKRKVSALRRFMDWLKSENSIDLGHAPDAPRFRGRKLPHFLSVDEVIAIHNYCSSIKRPNLQDREQMMLFYLLFGGGLRVSEACNLRWEDLNFAKFEARIVGKGKKERLCVLPAKTLENINANGQRGEKYIWGNQPLNRRTAYERVRQLGQQANLYKPLHPHALRHSYATQMLTSGTDLRVVQQLLGHASLAATEVYTHLDINDVARTLEKFHPLSNKN